MRTTEKRRRAEKHPPSRSYLWVWGHSGGVIGMGVGAVGGAWGGAIIGISQATPATGRGNPIELVMGLLFGLVAGAVLGSGLGAAAIAGVAAAIGGLIEMLWRKKQR